MSKKITDLQLIAAVVADLNVPGDDGIQTYRFTVSQLKDFILAAGNVGNTALAANAVTTSKIADANVTRAKLAQGAWAPMFFTSTNVNLTADPLTHDVIMVDVSGGDKTITLPPVAGLTGRCFIVKKSDNSTNKVIIDADAAETIDGELTFNIYKQHDSVKIVCTGTAWAVVEKNITKDTVICTMSANQSIPSASATVINFDTKIQDLKNQVLTGVGVWRYKADRDKAVRVSTSLQFQSLAYNANELFEGNLYTNNANPLSLGLTTHQNGAATQSPTLNGGTVVNLLKNDEIQVKAYQNSPAARNLIGNLQYSRISITEI